jgi:predicted metal-binding membrane protein
VFVGAYTVLWILVGLVPLAVDAVASIYSLATTWGSLYFGVSFLAVGAFQLSSKKRRYLHRRSYPPGGLADHAGPELESAARAGLVFGRWDLGSCGVPMGLMVVLGSTNVAWMLPITVALFVERTTSRGVRWASGFGLLAIGVGVWQIGVWFV